ncbi:hypothetical protein P153DRAFT_605 [Dothidotthia symphoricarpi CBS 119687]|uniref:Uncharacterized protein n=1 Tax=Dothidotthia symphoricarpi CBS 119687 TaxID=1392245 RepID=A0A6A6AR05_9PLEO|nr:uncharacterized protein P153DRAFT_605 [Dothidotthia symphoricarpi CBS 119687]KAF2134369.1 hypothetical protein P153DRAFT_605 [Dothidotthia symphoricarpi CBS 119687]
MDAHQIAHCSRRLVLTAVPLALLYTGRRLSTLNTVSPHCSLPGQQHSSSLPVYLNQIYTHNPVGSTYYTSVMHYLDCSANAFLFLEPSLNRHLFIMGSSLQISTRVGIIS